MRELIGMSYSPWTERARWVLQYHGLPFDYTEHVILTGIPYLRWRLRRPLGTATTPALIDEERKIRVTDSWNIALYADKHGDGKKILPTDSLDVIKGWNDRSEAMLDSGRALLIERLRQNPKAQESLLPPVIPAALKASFTFLASFGFQYVQTKFHSAERDLQEHRGRIRSELLHLRESLTDRPYLLDQFSYADLVMAGSLQVVQPIKHRSFKIAAVFRECWGDPSLAQEFPDLLAWRDKIYQQHRT